MKVYTPFEKRIALLFNHRKLQFTIVVLSLLPLFLINISNYHDWGGDFAQYIQQAIYIANGEPQSITNYIFNPDYKYLGPPSYPVGFPILLASVVKLFGNNILAFSYFITLSVVLTMIVVYGYFKTYYSFIPSYFATLFFAYNPWVLSFKSEIISDFPFALFIMVAIYLYVRRSNAQSMSFRMMFIGIILGYSILIKNIGAIVLFAMVVDFFLLSVKTKQNDSNLSSNLKRLVVLVSSSIIIYTSVALVIFPAEKELFSFFTSLYSSNNLIGTGVKTVKYYFNELSNIFLLGNSSLWLGSLLQKTLLIVLFVTGIYASKINIPRLVKIIIPFYLIAILFFPNTSQGFRYLLPIFPLVLFIIISGLIHMVDYMKGYKNAFYSILFIVFSVQYGNKAFRNCNKETCSGPLSNNSTELFQYIKDSTPIKARFIFVKPRVLGLYGERACCSNNPQSDYNSIVNLINKEKIDYVLMTTEILNPPLSEYLELHQDDLILRFENNSFKLFKLIQ